MDSLLSTAGPSNPFPLKTSAEIGLEAELKVIDHFRNRGCQLVFQRKKIAHVEIDLIFNDVLNQQFIAVEVKSVRGSFENFPRVSVSQIKRLKRTFQILIEGTGKEFELLVAYVNLEKETIEFQDFNFF